jgi:Spy/CpxP family protein refolding chaperone
LFPLKNRNTIKIFFNLIYQKRLEIMKKLAIVFAFMFAVVANTFAQADATPAPLQDATTSKVDRKANKMGKGDRKAKMKGAADDLGLSADQKAKMKEIGQSFKGKMKAIKTDASLSKDQKKAQIGEVAKSHETELKAIMTPEQFTKFTEMKKARKANKGSKRGKRGGAAQDDNDQ